ncbi:hypothetical protein FD755_011300 [Muntiacus reevesi]|uniref:Membrane-anchored junction protein n=1 Tax=Muntiacus reevesi TaxID=9886 RepID=A0A5N3XUI2_MUNRE|nr:hypothetical protein FD755_011300 [Muntiacus reevesi]
MSLKPFTYPFPETRFLHAGPNVYKFKIRYGNSIRGEEAENKEVIVQELEDSIRAVLGNLDNLQPFATEHFIVFPYKSKWERVSHLKFKHGETVLVPYPFVFTLYVEMKWFHENLSPGKSVNSSPLGLVLEERKAAEAVLKKRKFREVPSSPARPELDRSKEMATHSSVLAWEIPRIEEAGRLHQKRERKKKRHSEGIRPEAPQSSVEFFFSKAFCPHLHWSLSLGTSNFYRQNRFVCSPFRYSYICSSSILGLLFHNSP